jgi:hypothetical protein
VAVLEIDLAETGFGKTGLGMFVPEKVGLEKTETIAPAPDVPATIALVLGAIPKFLRWL